MNASIIIIFDRRTLGYAVKYLKLDRGGRSLHRSIQCGSPEEAAAHAIDIQRRVFEGLMEIVAPPGVKKYL